MSVALPAAPALLGQRAARALPARRGAGARRPRRLGRRLAGPPRRGEGPACERCGRGSGAGEGGLEGEGQVLGEPVDAVHVGVAVREGLEDADAARGPGAPRVFWPGQGKSQGQGLDVARGPGAPAEGGGRGCVVLDGLEREAARPGAPGEVRLRRGWAGLEGRALEARRAREISGNLG